MNLPGIGIAGIGILAGPPTGYGVDAAGLGGYPPY